MHPKFSKKTKIFGTVVPLRAERVGPARQSIKRRQLSFRKNLFLLVIDYADIANLANIFAKIKNVSKLFIAYS